MEIGIDPGRNTGFAIIDGNDVILQTFKLHQAFKFVEENKDKIRRVVIENPNLWKFFNDDKAQFKKQGAGSVKRDYSAWEDFLNDLGIKFVGVRPDKHRNSIAYNIDLFQRTTKYTKRCSEHARVALMLIWH